MQIPRETIMAALFAQLSAVPGFQTYGRRLRTASEVTAQPALFLRKTGETWPARPANGMPAKVTIHAEVWVYWKAQSPDPSVAPEIDGNALLDAVEAALAGAPRQENTLGGLVNRVWIEGKLAESHGDQTGQGIAVIDVSIMVPC